MTVPLGGVHVARGLMVASGFAGLGYQIVWTQQCALWLGHEAAAVLAVVTAYFGGLAVGALALGTRIQRSARPERWYAACEVTIAAWSLALALLLAPVSRWMLAFTGVEPGPLWQWSVAFLGTFVVLLPATVAMGATLPAIERVVVQASPGHRAIAALYACNTLGAVLGVLATAFWLAPHIGLAGTAAVCAVLNVLCAGLALRLRSDPSPRAAPSVAPSFAPSFARARRAPLPMLAATGLLGIGYEVLVVRVLSQVVEDTVYTFAILLAIYLAGTALGAAACQRWAAGPDGAVRLRGRLLRLQAAGCLLGAASLWGAAHVQRFVLHALGPGMPVALMAEAAVALVAFGVPTVVMGALFCHLCMMAGDAGNSLGRAIGFNTVGAAAAPVIFGVLLVPALGPKFALLLVVGGYLALSLAGARATPLFWGSAAASALIAVFAPALAFIEVPEGGRVLGYRDGAMASVSVVQDAAGVAVLRIDNRQQEGSSATALADSRQALLPLLLHPRPRRALFLGLGTGVTAAAAAEDASVQVDAVELLPEVIDASAHFMASGSVGRTRLRVMAADARRYVVTTPLQYDVIVADNFHPARSGSGALYTVEHFLAVRERLTDGGVFCQWLPLHQLDLETLRSIVQSFIAAYPGAWAMLATNSLETPVIGLVARRGVGLLSLIETRQRLASTTLPRRVADAGLVDEFALLGGFVAGPRSLARFAANAPINTDDHPVVAYKAPRITYAPDSLPRERLSSLLRELQIAPADLVDAGRADDTWSRRLAAYWVARDRFIEAGQAVRASGSVERMLAQVREPLLSVLRISPDFRPAYDPLLRMAIALGRTDPAAARSLLNALRQVQPARPEASLAQEGLAAAQP